MNVNETAVYVEFSLLELLNINGNRRLYSTTYDFVAYYNYTYGNFIQLFICLFCFFIVCLFVCLFIYVDRCKTGSCLVESPKERNIILFLVSCRQVLDIYYKCC